MVAQKGQNPTAPYQCVSRPGRCKFEWNCGPLCACVVSRPPETEEERADVRKAARMQARWRKGLKE